jgi:predicted kinase
MNKIFALCGKPGSGKSTLAIKISKQYKSVIFSVDKIMLKLFGEIDGRELFEQKSRLCKEAIYEICDNLLVNTKINIILDFGFWSKEERYWLRDHFRKYKVIFIYLNTDSETNWERIDKRNENLKPSEYFFDRDTFNFLSNMFDDFSEEEFIEYRNITQLKLEIRRISK